MSKTRRDDDTSRTWNTRIEQNIYLPLKSYSPWSHLSSTMWLVTKSSNVKIVVKRLTWFGFFYPVYQRTFLAHVSFVYEVGFFFLSLGVCFTTVLFCGSELHSEAGPGPEQNSGNLNESLCIAMSMNFYWPGYPPQKQVNFLGSVYHPPNIWTFQVTPLGEL